MLKTSVRVLAVALTALCCWASAADALWLKGVLPFVWDEAKGNVVPMSIGAMYDDGTPDPSQPSGTVTTSYGNYTPIHILGYLNEAGQPIAAPMLQNGNWRGFVVLHNPTDAKQDLMIQLGISTALGWSAGNTNPLTLTPIAVAPIAQDTPVVLMVGGVPVYSTIIPKEGDHSLRLKIDGSVRYNQTWDNSP